MRSIHTSIRRVVAILSICAVAATSTFMAPTAVSASTLNSIYSYTLDGSTSTITNDAAANANVDLHLHGDWSQSAFGVFFDGDTTSKQSVGYAKPSSGYTINVPANNAVGGAVKFKYQAPASGCFSDSINVTQAGRFGANVGQIKIQLSKCSVSNNQVYTQCRMAGASSGTNVKPVTGTQALVDGETYVVSCAKSADPSSGNATLELTTARLSGTPQTTVDTFSIAPTGMIRTSAYLSVANKYKLPSIANNTDQFVGDIAKVAYCQATTLSAVNTCMTTEIPL